jgi:hypothetical protein
LSKALKSGLWPLAMVWLAVHAALLVLILGVKFLAAKTIVLMLLLAGIVLFLFGRRMPARLSHKPVT